MALIHKAPANAGLSTTRTPSPVRAAGLLLGLTLLATVPLSACSATGEADPLPTSTLSAASTPSVDAHHTPAQQPQAQRTRARQAQATLTAFVDAARRGDAAVTTSLVSGRDPTFATRTRVWADNLQGIDWAAMTWTVRAQQAPLSAERRSALGADAWVQEVSVTWSLPGESRRAEERLWLTFVTDATVNDVTGAPGSGTGAPTGSGGTVRLAGERDGPSRLTATPLWLMQPVRLYTDDGVRLLTDADAGHAAHDWLRIAAAARAQTISRVGAAARDRETPLVVEIPQSRTAFERVLGVAENSYATVAAAAWPMGTDTATAPIHVVVNPESSARLSPLGRKILLTHEAVHVVTRSPGSAAPTWLVEGYADQIAYRAHPDARVPALTRVTDEVQAHGAPTDWPAESDFAPTAKHLDLAYDLAWTACRFIAAAHGTAGLNRLYAAVDHGATLEGAADRLGTSEPALLRGWRADLSRLAKR